MSAASSCVATHTDRHTCIDSITSMLQLKQKHREQMTIITPVLMQLSKLGFERYWYWGTGYYTIFANILGTTGWFYIDCHCHTQYRNCSDILAPVVR